MDRMQPINHIARTQLAISRQQHHKNGAPKVEISDVDLHIRTVGWREITAEAGQPVSRSGQISDGSGQEIGVDVDGEPERGNGIGVIDRGVHVVGRRRGDDEVAVSGGFAEHSALSGKDERDAEGAAHGRGDHDGKHEEVRRLLGDLLRRQRQGCRFCANVADAFDRMHSSEVGNGLVTRTDIDDRGRPVATVSIEGHADVGNGENRRVGRPDLVGLGLSQ